MYTGGKCPEPSWPVDGYAGRIVTVRGTVCDRTEKNGTYQIFLKNVSFQEQNPDPGPDRASFPVSSKGIVVKPSGDGSDIKLGSRIEARGVFTPFEEPRCEGQFDQRTYYMIRGYEGQLKRARITGASVKYDIVAERLRDLRDRAYAVLLENLDEEDASLTAAMTLGDKSGLDEETKQLYQDAGISHVLALSGLHIASVGLALLAMLKKTGLPPAVSSALAFTVIAAYAVMTGMSISTVRALIMFGLFVLSGMLGRSYDILTAAALSAVMILTVRSSYMYDPGFLLSFGAIVGIIFIYPVLADMPALMGISGRRVTDSEEERPGGMPERIRAIPKKLYQSVCISLSVTLATLPVTGMSFMRISLCSVFINLLVIPLMSIVLITGFSGIITGLIGIKPAVILEITHYILRFYRVLGETSEKIEGNVFVTGKPGKWQVITYVIIMIVIITAHNNMRHGTLLNNRKKKIVDPTSRHFAQNNKSDFKIRRNKITYMIENGQKRMMKKLKNRGKVIITIVMTTAAFYVFVLHPRQELEIRNVDVGQGDCALIWGKDIPAVMIDGGSSDIKQVAKYRIVPVLMANRVTDIGYCFLTHMDSDHVCGVIEMLEDMSCPVRIRRVVVSDLVFNESGGEASESFKRLVTAAERKKTDVISVSAGDVVIAGNMMIKCISPDDRKAAGTGAASSYDENDASLVLSLCLGSGSATGSFSALFTGDISSDVEEKIQKRIEDCTYLKVAHHGSRYSTADVFLSAASPEISVISAGRDNSYGHPHAETLKRLRAAGTGIYRTDQKGEIIVTKNKGKLSVRTFMTGQGDNSMPGP